MIEKSGVIGLRFNIIILVFLSCSEKCELPKTSEGSSEEPTSLQ